MARRTLLAVCALQWGCGGPPPPAPTAPTTPTVVLPLAVVLSGRVVESTTGDPVAANLLISRPGGSLQSQGAADANGAFRITDLAPGDITIVAALTGYEPVERQVTLTADTSLVLSIVPRRFVLSGRVTDIDSRTPLAGATLTVLDGQNASRTTVTSSDGTFRLPELWFMGFTIRVRQAGYDSVFRGIRLVEDTVSDFELRRAEQSLAGTWTGTVALGPTEGSLLVPEVTLTHAGTAVAAATLIGGSFSGTLRDPSRIGSTTELTGALTWNRTTGPARGPMNCRGTGNFTGTVNWTQLRITAPNVVYECAGVAPHPVTISLVRQQ